MIFIVLVYNKTIFESQTLKSLNYQKNNIPYSSKIIVFNNGTKVFMEEDENIFCNDLSNYVEVTIIDGGKNESSAIIHNTIISDYYADKYIIFDDDTNVNEDFLINSKLSYDIVMPWIRSHGNYI
ncbi:MAG: hypothetical protein ACJA0H_001177 [Francisellaceae bacterium]|jgi:hypothetical protein